MHCGQALNYPVSIRMHAVSFWMCRCISSGISMRISFSEMDNSGYFFFKIRAKIGRIISPIITPYIQDTVLIRKDLVVAPQSQVLTYVRTCSAKAAPTGRPAARKSLDLVASFLRKLASLRSSTSSPTRNSQVPFASLRNLLR